MKIIVACDCGDYLFFILDYDCGYPRGEGNFNSKFLTVCKATISIFIPQRESKRVIFGIWRHDWGTTVLQRKSHRKFFWDDKATNSGTSSPQRKSQLKNFLNSRSREFGIPSPQSKLHLQNFCNYANPRFRHPRREVNHTSGIFVIIRSNNFGTPSPREKSHLKIYLRIRGQDFIGSLKRRNHTSCF